ncbi:hypothetical protein HDV00_006524 [Rhizophlyctis rosea]|nr:hypothetical protein HDV00_006524 [Rhizophlyctis rosea]
MSFGTASATRGVLLYLETIPDFCAFDTIKLLVPHIKMDTLSGFSLPMIKMYTKLELLFKSQEDAGEAYTKLKAVKDIEWEGGSYRVLDVRLGW